MRKLVSLFLAIVLFGATAIAALAHPLGNFTINHYARLEMSPHQIRIRYVLDYAEIPTFQEKQNMDPNGDAQISDAERAAYLASSVERLIGNLKLSVNNQAVALALEPNTAQLSFTPGQGGLNIMRIAMWLDAPFQLSNSDAVTFADTNYSDRLGWREIVVPARDGISIQNSNVPATETSQELTLYPENLLNNPRNDRQATFTVTPGTGTVTQSSSLKVVDTGPLGVLDRTREQFGQLLTSNQELSPLVLLVTFFIAMGLGALHAFSPGHGKAVVGAYLVGSRGNWTHAVFLGLIVTVTHTAGVYALGAITLFLAAYVVPDQLFPWLEFLSGALVAIIGVRLFIERFRAARSHTGSYDQAMNRLGIPPLALTPAYAGSASNAQIYQTAGAHAHSRGQVHSHDFAAPEQAQAHARQHLAEIQALEKPSWKNLLSLGMSGGLLPCPSALVVMLSAIALGRVLYGFYLIIGFSLGLAGVLVLTGLALLYAGKFAGRYLGGQRVGTVMRYVPIVGAFLVAILGLGIALGALINTGFIP